MVNTAFVGKITNEAGEPLEDVAVTAGTRTINTDEYGVFRLNDVTISEQFGFLKAEKTGYFLVREQCFPKKMVQIILK